MTDNANVSAKHIDKISEQQKTIHVLQIDNLKYKAAFDKSLQKFKRLRDKYKNVMKIFQSVGEGMREDSYGSLMNSNVFDAVDLECEDGLHVDDNAKATDYNIETEK